MGPWYTGTLILPDFKIPDKNAIVYRTFIEGDKDYTNFFVNSQNIAEYEMFALKLVFAKVCIRINFSTLKLMLPGMYTEHA